MVLGILKKKASEPIKAAKKEEKLEPKPIDEKPKLFLIDFESEVTNQLREKRLNAFSGSLGKQIQIQYPSPYQPVPCQLNCDIPNNLHEFQIVILNLHDAELIDYDSKEHLVEKNSGDSQTYFVCQYPQTIFDPKPFCSQFFLQPQLDQILNKQGIFIVFSNAFLIQKYQTIIISRAGANPHEQYSISNYNFSNEIPNPSNKSGQEMVVEENLHYTKILKKHLPGSSYDVIFSYPTVYDESRNLIPDPLFQPLIWNEQREVVSFIKVSRNGGIIFFFPNIKEKTSFITELLTEVLPSIFNEIFPNYSKYQWVQDPTYQLPNARRLIEEKKAIITEFENKIKAVDQEIQENHQKYACLHNLLIDDGKNLVKDVEKFLFWLGFKNVKNMDEISPEKLEEDLQIEHESGLLIIEVKGIGGTSTDEQCSQISKNVLRRQMERGKTDVHGLYIVNHQKHLPPLNRENPPFNDTQITDAVNDQRGLISTWQLFNLYLSIKNGAITKEEVRATFLCSGLIEFTPNNAISLGKPKNIMKEGYVILLDLSSRVQKNGSLFIKRDERYYPAKIIEIQKDRNFVDVADSCGVGIKIDMPARPSDEFYYRDSG